MADAEEELTPMQKELARKKAEREKRTAAKAASENKTDTQRAAEEKAKMQAYLAKDLAEERKQFKELHAIHDRVRAADLESWYEALKAYTYPTLFVPISFEDGAAIRKWRDFHRLQATTAATAAGVKPPPFTDAKALAAIEGMKTRLQAALDTFKTGAFVKLSSRSPKDAAVTSQRTIQLFRQALTDRKSQPAATATATATATAATTGSGGSGSGVSDNDKLIAINRAHILALRVTSADEVLNTFLASERIYEDLQLASEHPSKWSQKFVLRQWIDIPIEYEFRGFVYNNELTALSQYYHFCYFPEVSKNKELILQKIRKFFLEIRSHVPLTPKEYVVDFALDMANDRVYIIELNPFGTYEGMGTSTSMFDKKKDEAVLFGDGKTTFQFRIETEPPADIFKIMGDAWKELFIAEGFAPPPTPTDAKSAAAVTGTGTGSSGGSGGATASLSLSTPSIDQSTPPLARAPSDRIEHTPKHKQQPPATK